MPYVAVFAVLLLLYLGRDVISARVLNDKVLNRSKANGVHPELQLALDEWNGPFAIKVLSGVRTDAEQRALYAKGRTEPGNIVTNAQSAGDSAHGRGAALDVVPAPNGSALWDIENGGTLAMYNELSRYFISRGFDWGGNWSTLKDMPHFEMKNWRILQFPPPDYDSMYARKVSTV